MVPVAASTAPRRVRVAIVDDAEKIRTLLRFSFEDDERFELVGEAANGAEAIELARRTRPDLLLLDRQMPVMGGVEAIPWIRQSAPRTAIVLYTAGGDMAAYQAALAAGAIDVLEKAAAGPALVDALARVLLDRWAGPEADVEVRLGPVASSAARIWVDNTLSIVAALRAHPEVLGDAVPAVVLDVFEHFLESWLELAATTDDFFWVARARVTDVQHLVEHWALIDRMSDQQLAALGCHWAPKEGEPFFRALTAAVLDAIATREETQELAQVLARQWPGVRLDP